jgi:uncharacterized membrane protein
MNTEHTGHPGLERLLAVVLHYGTWLASAVIALGLVLAAAGSPNLGMLSSTHIVTAGIAMFILLPILRVAVMLIVFVLERDYRFGAIAALVLAIIGLGIALGMAKATAG